VSLNNFFFIRIRPQETNLKQFCLRDFTPAISVISIILQARTIRFPVAILLPEVLQRLQFEASFGFYIVSDVVDSINQYSFVYCLYIIPSILELTEQNVTYPCIVTILK